MRIIVSNAFLKALLDFVYDVTADSNLSSDTKQVIDELVYNTDTKTSEKQETSLYKCKFCSDRMETRIEIDEKKLMAILAVSSQHLAIFVTIFNIFVTAIRTIISIKEMLTNIPLQFDQQAQRLEAEIQQILDRPASWVNRQKQRAKE